MFAAKEQYPSFFARRANAYYDGTVSPAYKAFETRFAGAGVGGIITATISVNRRRMSPLEYPLHDDRYVEPLKDVIRADQAQVQSQKDF
jgi:2,4-dienoyl-CoA reductase-like NADH-dependent reductase (Old Yellow Enzyme family)